MVSDFSVFHQIRDVWSMPSAVFAVMAERLPAYSGAVRAALFAAAQAEQETGGGGEAEGAPPPYLPSAPAGGDESFESRMARAKPILANAAGEAQISRLMAAGA